MDSLIELIFEIFGEKADELLEISSDIENKEDRIMFYKGLIDAAKTGVTEKMLESISYKFDPVNFEEFLFGEYYLNLSRSSIWKPFLKELIEVNSGKYMEAVFTGAIGSGKSTAALYTTAYQLYLLSALRNPQELLGIGQSDEILIIFQSLRASHAKKVDYGRFRALIERSPYFNYDFPFDTHIKSEMVFPNRIYVRPVSSSVTATIGENVFCGIIDEINFFSVVQQSARSEDGTGLFDQAKEIYDSLAIRRQSRFMNKHGDMPGILCLVSSRKVPGEFTDRKEAEILQEIRDTGSSPCYFYDKRIWELQPENYKDEWFYIFRGDKHRDPKIIKENELWEYDENFIMKIPEVYRKNFIQNIYKSMRDIAGLTARSSNPFLPNMLEVNKCFRNTFKSILSREQTDFNVKEISVYPNRFENLNLPRFVHIDGSLTSDSTGISCCYIVGFKTVKITDKIFEMLPIVRYDFTLRVNPPTSGEIDLERLKSLPVKLRELGLPIEWITYDTYQSANMVQTLRKMRFKTGNLSVDTSPTPYDMFKDALLQGRIESPIHTFVQEEELGFLEEIIENKRRKIDHPIGGQKDCTDSMVGAHFGVCSMRKAWRVHGVSWKKGGQIEANAKMINRYKRSKTLNDNDLLA